MNQLIETLNLYFGKKAPQLPKGGREVIVKAAPYLVIVSVLLGLPAVLALLGMGAAMPYLVYGMNYGVWYVSLALGVVAMVLEIIALPGLFKPSPKGWNFSFYSMLVSAVSNLVTMNIIGMIIGLIIGFYILFQVKEYYFGGPIVVVPPSQTPPTPPVPPVQM